jgi:hypothetical protein
MPRASLVFDSSWGCVHVLSSKSMFSQNVTRLLVLTILQNLIGLISGTSS